jgi:hypothetical protein
MLMVVSPSQEVRDSFVERLIETKAAVLSPEKVHALIAGRVDEDKIDDAVAQLLEKAALKRLEAGETVVIPAKGLDPEERERWVRMAAGFKRPRHIVLIEPARDQVDDEDRAALNDLRRRLDAGELGQEGFQTALRLGGGSVGELKRLVFRPAPRDD